MRLFAAVDPDENARALLVRAIAEGRALAPGARWASAASLHVTLAFLGEVEEARVAGVREALDRAALGAVPFDLALATAGSFGPARHPRVLWAGVGVGGDALGRLQAGVAAELALVGFPAEERGYTPHITLARVRAEGGDPALATARDALRAADFGRVEIREIVLYRSERGAEGPRYTALHRSAIGRAP